MRGRKAEGSGRGEVRTEKGRAGRRGVGSYSERRELLTNAPPPSRVQPPETRNCPTKVLRIVGCPRPSVRVVFCVSFVAMRPAESRKGGKGEADPSARLQLRGDVLCEEVLDQLKVVRLGDAL